MGEAVDDKNTEHINVKVVDMVSILIFIGIVSNFKYNF